MPTRVKFCGITRIEDAEYAVELGAQAIGLVFYAKSPRSISLQDARAIRLAMPAFFSVVGLFVNPDVEEVEQVLAQVPLDLLQFHGDESEDFCQQFNKPYLKALRIHQQSNPNLESKAYPSARSLLFDAHDAKQWGGTGKTLPWDKLDQKRMQRQILAGGLNPDNVKQAIQTLRPFAVDVSSGVEKEPGIKDNALMRAFVQQVAQAD